MNAPDYTFKETQQGIIIEKYNGTYVTKGDANTAKDSPINKEQIKQYMCETNIIGDERKVIDYIAKEKFI
mgnify:CR=1 FL=1